MALCATVRYSLVASFGNVTPTTSPSNIYPIQHISRAATLTSGFWTQVLVHLTNNEHPTVLPDVRSISRYNNGYLSIIMAICLSQEPRHALTGSHAPCRALHHPTRPSCVPPLCTRAHRAAQSFKIACRKRLVCRTGFVRRKGLVYRTGIVQGIACRGCTRQSSCSAPTRYQR